MVARVLLVSMLLAAPMLAEDNFYEQQLVAGKTDAQANRLSRAADELRIAAFGLMQQPALLQEALARLAVVQNALGHAADLSKTLERFTQVEQRFGGYAEVQLDASVRAKFEDLVVKQVPPATLQAIPSLARLSKSEMQKIAELPPAQRIAAYEAGAKREPKNPQWPLALAKEAASRELSADVIRWGTRVVELDPANREVRPLLAHARAARRECRDAFAVISGIDLQQNPDVYADQASCFAYASRWKEADAALARVPERLRGRPDVKQTAQLVARENENVKAQEAARKTPPVTAKTAPSQTRPTATVPQASSATPPPPKAADVIDAARKLVKDGKFSDAVRQLRPALQADPDNRALRLALLEASVLARDWRTASAQVPVVTPLAAGEELYMFYASVALYETGRRDEAKLFMEKARPRMVSSPMVDYYLRAVLGPSSPQRGG